MDTEYQTQKWIHRDLRSARAAADRIAAHFRQELAAAEQTSRLSNEVPPWADGDSPPTPEQVEQAKARSDEFLGWLGTRRFNS
jgi:hypothetical protein